MGLLVGHLFFLGKYHIYADLNERALFTENN